MRLEVLRSGFRPLQRVQMWIIARLAGDVPPPVRTMSYRREFFGKEFAPLIHEAMRGPSPWSVGEREIFSAFVSRLNQCEY